MGTMRISRFVVLAALAAVAILSALSVPRDARTETCVETKQLTWNGGSLTKTFATVQDTGFLALPDDIAWDWQPWAAGASYGFARLTFVNTGAGAANADTIRYQLISQGGSTRAYVSLVEQTAAFGNVALNHGGRVYVGTLVSNGVSSAANGAVFPKGANAVIKVAGDPNGALTSVTAYLTYPRRCGAR